MTEDDPWGWGASLEWATSSPPPRHNFVSLPRIRSERPAFDLHHPELAEWDVEGYLATLDARTKATASVDTQADSKGAIT